MNICPSLLIVLFGDSAPTNNIKVATAKNVMHNLIVTFRALATCKPPAFAFLPVSWSMASFLAAHWVQLESPISSILDLKWQAFTEKLTLLVTQDFLYNIFQLKTSLLLHPH